MKRLISIIMVFLLLGCLTLAVHAESSLSISNGTGARGETVFLTVGFDQSVVGDSVGIDFSFDKSQLEVNVKSCSWERSGTIKDFSKAGNDGVWIGASAVDLQGELCSLAFRIKDHATALNTQVTCTVVVKNGTEQVGSYSAIGEISIECNHIYGNWEAIGEFGHTRQCLVCGSNQTQSHNWSSISDKDTVKQCDVCGLKRTSDGMFEEMPTEPITLPTIGETKPTEEERPNIEPTIPIENIKPDIEPTIPIENIKPDIEPTWPKEDINPNSKPTMPQETLPGTFAPIITEPTEPSIIGGFLQKDDSSERQSEPLFRDYNELLEQNPVADTHNHSTQDWVNPDQDAHQHNDTEDHDGAHEAQIADDRNDGLVLLILAGVAVVLIFSLCMMMVYLGKKRKK